MDVSIVIRTKNEARFLEETLRRLRGQDFYGECETVIVDSGSTDATLDIAKNYDVRVLEIPQKEFSYGRSLNIGAENSRGRFIVNLSAHAWPVDEKWLSNLVSGFSDYGVGAVYGRQLSNGGMNPFEALKNDQFFGSQEITFNNKHKRRQAEPHFSNSNSAVRKTVWEKLKFDENVGWAEDILWQEEVMSLGFSVVYVPAAVVSHTHEVNFFRAYKSSKECAVTLASMEGKKRSLAMVMYDVGTFLILIPRTMFENAAYSLKNRYYSHLMAIPAYVLSALLGWLAGRVEYRTSKYTRIVGVKPSR